MTHLQEQLEHLKESLLEMAMLVQKQLMKSVEALLQEDRDLANEVLYNEKRVNAFELGIDKDCEQIFALLSPVAHDMRFVFATLKTNGDLERIGDYAEGIAKLVLAGIDEFDRDLSKDIQLKRMYEVAYAMLEDVIQAYSTDNTKLARSVFSRDLELNKINQELTPKIVEYCRTNPDRINQALLQLSIVRRLERVGDHVTNIAEEIIFYKEATVLKHGNKGNTEQD